MNSIINNKEEITIIKKSKFIGIIKEISSKEEADTLLNEYKELYKDATHICYAYIVNNLEKMSDDGEPSGTAGIPMLDLLRKKELNNVIGIVIRYFGGIKLGANGLVRAYVNCLNKTLDNNICTLIDGYNITISFNYNIEKEISYLLKESIIYDKKYEDIVTYNLDVTEDILNKLKNLNINIIKIESKKIKLPN